MEIGGVEYDNYAIVGDGYVELRTYQAGALYSGDALLSSGCMIIVKTYNK